jgi:hypothetical protein
MTGAYMHTSRRRAFLAAALLAMVGCGPKIDIKAPICVKTVVADVDVPTQQAADILIVVDNSLSMKDEQANLAANFLNSDGNECPLQDLKNIPDQFKNPEAALYTGDGPLAKCGFIQLIAAFDNDFRIGVVTTDVALCDNELDSAPDGWGFRPQAGCLHGDGVPGTDGIRKVIARADLEDDDDTNDDFATRFQATLTNIGNYGSIIERGLDGMDLFLDDSDEARAKKNPECVDDLASFRRDNASLVVIFLTDEDDCSHGLNGDPDPFGNELANDVCGSFPGLIGSQGEIPHKCYAEQDKLTPVSDYVSRLKAHDANAKVAVIAGSVDGSTPGGCLVGADGAPIGGDDVCFASEGRSNFDGAGPTQFCGPDTAADRNGLACCVADGGGRYFEFADDVGNKATNSICNRSFRGTMIDIAAFIAAVDVVTLAEPPDSPNAILVSITRAGGDEEETLLRVPDGGDCATTTGYILEDPTHIRLCGDARPGPGDKLRVRARGSADTSEAVCGQPFFEASGGGVNCAATDGGGAGDIALVAAAFGGAFIARRRRGRA